MDMGMGMGMGTPAQIDSYVGRFDAYDAAEENPVYYYAPNGRKRKSEFG